ncbi:hypothetical protein COO60DRAFT_179593 [Scenedesmus sp. NREL 46B-D3]|nr:hypothetical protein COO60DRAFT_179593 [Scenedesmus sp. NREL 46B-D3]
MLRARGCAKGHARFVSRATVQRVHLLIRAKLCGGYAAHQVAALHARERSSSSSRLLHGWRWCGWLSVVHPTSCAHAAGRGTGRCLCRIQVVWSCSTPVPEVFQCTHCFKRSLRVTVAFLGLSGALLRWRCVGDVSGLCRALVLCSSLAHTCTSSYTSMSYAHCIQVFRVDAVAGPPMSLWVAGCIVKRGALGVVSLPACAQGVPWTAAVCGVGWLCVAREMSSRRALLSAVCCCARGC